MWFYSYDRLSDVCFTFWYNRLSYSQICFKFAKCICVPPTPRLVYTMHTCAFVAINEFKTNCTIRKSPDLSIQ